ncbi:MAG TPA: hypothetical protein VIH21_02990, partial [Dehalococcoidia bacterium]
MNSGVGHTAEAEPRRTHLFAQPLTWLAIGVAGLLLVCGGVALEAYRHNHGADAGDVVSSSNPGVLIAIA